MFCLPRETPSLMNSSSWETKALSGWYASSLQNWECRRGLRPHLRSLFGAPSARVLSVTAWLLASVGEDTLVTKGAAAEVVALADLLA